MPNMIITSKRTFVNRSHLIRQSLGGTTCATVPRDHLPLGYLSGGGKRTSVSVYLGCPSVQPLEGTDCLRTASSR
jgi:hypothetical protein